MLERRKMLGTDLYSCYNKLKCDIFPSKLMEFVTVYPVFVQYIEESFLNDKKCYIYKVNPI